MDQPRPGAVDRPNPRWDKTTEVTVAREATPAERALGDITLEIEGLETALAETREEAKRLEGSAAQLRHREQILEAHISALQKIVSDERERSDDLPF